MMTNQYFTAALKKAASLMGRPGKLFLLLSQLALKLKEVNWSSISRQEIKEKLFVFGRLIKAYAQGTYREIPLKNLALIIAAVLYFVNPLDLVPDFIPITGLADDFAILLWIFRTLNGEIDKFITWERTTLHS